MAVDQTVRDDRYEREFLNEVERTAERRYGVTAGGFGARVSSRLMLGAERYGDEDFLAKDVLRELLEETPDVAAYALLEVQKILATAREDEDHAHHLFEAAVHAAAADYHARRARAAGG